MIYRISKVDILLWIRDKSVNVSIVSIVCRVSMVSDVWNAENKGFEMFL